MNASIVQRQIVETARERGFTEKHIAVMSFEIGKTLFVDRLGDRQMETLLDALRREKPEMESVWDENVIGLMCRCQDVFRHSRVSIWTPIEDHEPACAFRRFIELTED